MKKKLKVIVLFSLIIPFTVKGQQIPHFTQYMFNGIFQNPAHINKTDYADASLFYRYQWTGISESPQTVAFLLDYPIGHEKIELGMFFLQSKLGVQTKQRFNANIVYRTPLDKSHKNILAFGGNVGVIGYKVGKFDNLTDEQDVVLNAIENQSVLLPDVSFGTTLKMDRVSIGISGSQLVPFSSSNGSFSLQPHYNILTSYIYNLNNRIDLIPTLLLKYVNGANPEVDLNTNILFNKQFWVGGSYRTGDAVSVLIGGNFYDKKRAHNKIYRIGYAFDLTTSGLNQYNFGSHEIMLSILFRTKDPVKCKGDLPAILNNNDFLN